MHKYEAVQVVKVLDILLELSDTSIISNNFLTSFVEYSQCTDGDYRLYGSYKLGGTVSGRPTSSSPNMLNLPSTRSVFAKPVKKCFGAAEGRLMVGADYTGLEAVVGAIISEDKKMLGPYIDGFDGHSMRAVAFFPEDLVPIVTLLRAVEVGKKFFIDDSKSGFDKFIIKGK